MRRRQQRCAVIYNLLRLLAGWVQRCWNLRREIGSVQRPMASLLKVALCLAVGCQRRVLASICVMEVAAPPMGIGGHCGLRSVVLINCAGKLSASLRG